VPVGRGEAKVILHGFPADYLVGVVVLESKCALGACALKLDFVAVEMWHIILQRWTLSWVVDLLSRKNSTGR